MSPDDFYDRARAELLLALRDQPALSAAVNFKEGCEFVNAVALRMTAIYRGALIAPVGDQ